MAENLKIMVLNGPNLNMLGIREPSVYGNRTYTDLENYIEDYCKEKGIEKCYVNSFGWRRKFYNAAGFSTEDSIGFWHKTIR